MAGCCDPRGCDDLFGRRFAAYRAGRYRKRGLDRDAARMVDFICAHGVEGATVLEIGGGVGDLQVELLRRGAARVVSLELVDAYDAEAASLLAEAGLTGRVERRLVDIAVSPGEVERADVVVLHRVVCCYPDHERLLAAAADHARRLLVFSHPPRNVLSRALLAVQNAGYRLTGKTFRNFVHSPSAMVEVARAHGLEGGTVDGGVIWKVIGLRRPT